MNINDILNQAISSSTIGQLSQNLGTDDQTTSNAVQAALPMLLGALTQNSSNSEGASSLLSALDRDHDGSILDDLGGFLGSNNTGLGSGILGHVLGSRLGAAQSAVSQASGLDENRTTSLLMMLAPIVMGALGRAKRQGGLDENSLSESLGGATKQVASDSSVLDTISQVLDSNHDGSSLDDIARLAGNLFGRK
jgi:hypothetical protein